VTKGALEKELQSLEKDYWQAMKGKDVEAMHALTDCPCIVADGQGVTSVDDLVFDGVEYQAGTALASRHSVLDLERDAFRYLIEMGLTREAPTVMTIQYRRAPG
jgi:hypothetical protein